MKKLNNFEDFLSLLVNVTENADGGYTALCPAHNDTKPSLSIKQADNGRVLVHCFAGCAFKDILTAMDVDPARPIFTGQINGEDTTKPANGGKGDYSVIVPEFNSKSSDSAQVKGVTVHSFATVKKLPEAFLKANGLADVKYNGESAVSFPHRNVDGETKALFYRLTLTADSPGKRFAWKKGDKPILYGLDRLESIRKAGWVLLVEGPSDSLTLWLHDLPAIGIPGKSTWRTEWANYFKGLDVYLWQEPDAEDLTKKVFESIPTLKVIRAPEGVKDISEAHIQGKPITTYIEKLKTKAIVAKDIQAGITEKELNRLYGEAKTVIESDDPLFVIENGIRKIGYGGDIKPAIITYLAATTRLLEMRIGSMPVHELLVGPSSSGKTYTVGITKLLLPKEAYYEIDVASPTALIYGDEPLKNKVLIFSEADSMPKGNDSTAACVLRSLLQNNEVSYEVTVIDKETGKRVVLKIHKEGPTSVLTTSTSPLEEQLATRMFAIEMRDDKEQINAALRAQAQIEIKGVFAPAKELISFQRYLQLKAPISVFVPFAEGLSAALIHQSLSTPRILRDYNKLISMVKAVAIIRQFLRKRDDQGRIIAELTDYEKVRELVNSIYVDTKGASKDVCDLIDAVAHFSDRKRPDYTDKISGTKLANYLDISSMSISRRAKKAIEMGWLINKEWRKGYPANYELGEPLPSEVGLPSSHNIEYYLEQDYNTADDTLISLENTDHNALTPVSKVDDIVTDDSLDINQTQ